MHYLLDIRLQKLFVIVLCLKILSSGLGWYFRFPWSLGFWIPLFFMASYIVLGLKRHDSDVSDEKFADTCYYLGFIFTITSIIFSLFDLPSIGDKIQEIAVRFGAAMVSTVLGLGVRVYLVSFKKDIADAIADAEDAVLDASKRLAEQLTMALEKLHGFEVAVDAATTSSVERVNLQVESLSKNHADRLSEFFADLTERNQSVFAGALGEVKLASERLATAVNGYSHGMRTNLMSIEAKVGVFADAVTSRLKATTFPDDFFSRHLEGPLIQMRESANVLSTEVKAVSAEIRSSSKAISGIFKKMEDQAANAGDSLDTVMQLAKQQQLVLDSARGQIGSLDQLTTTLKDFEAVLSGITAAQKSNNEVTTELTNRISSVLVETIRDRANLEDSLHSVIKTIELGTVATHEVATKLDANSVASTAAASIITARFDAGIASTSSSLTNLASKFDANAAATKAAASASNNVAAKLAEVALADNKAATLLDTLSQRTNGAISRVDRAVIQFQNMTQQLTNLDVVLRAQSAEFKRIADHVSSQAAPAMPSVSEAIDAEMLIKQDAEVVPGPATMALAN